MLQNVEAELPSLLRGVDLRLPRGRQQLEVLHEAAQRDAENRQRKDDPRAAPPPNPEGEVPKVVAVGLDLSLLLQEPLGPELFGLLPVGRVVGKPPSIHQDLALGRDVEATQLRVVEVHVGNQ